MGTTNTLDLNNRVSELEKAVSGGDSAQANKSDIATEFSATTAYTAGCFVYYGGKLYQFNADHSAGAWDPTDVVEANVTDQVVSNKAAIDGLTASDVAYGSGTVEDALDGLQGYRVLNSVTADGTKTYKELINALFDGVVIDDNQTIIVKVVNSYYHMTYNSIRYKEFCNIIVENGHLRVRDINYDNQLTGTHLEESDTTVSGTTFNYLSNTALTQGYTLALLAR